MSVVVSPDSPEAQELAKWESRPTRNCPEPLRPYEFKPFPAMFYRAERPTGRLVFEELVVGSEREAANMRSRGWGSGQAEALEMLEDRERQIAVAAAERAHGELRMSNKARAEAERVDDSTDLHVPSIPETPIRRKPGRPAKVKE